MIRSARAAALRAGRRPDGPEPPLPGMATMARNLAAAAAGAALDGFRRASPELAAARLDVCRSCEHFRRSDRRCGLCGCGTQPKAALLSSSCPAGRWPDAGAAPG